MTTCKKGLVKLVLHPPLSSAALSRSPPSPLPYGAHSFSTLPYGAHSFSTLSSPLRRSLVLHPPLYPTALTRSPPSPLLCGAHSFSTLPSPLRRSLVLHPPLCGAHSFTIVIIVLRSFLPTNLKLFKLSAFPNKMMRYHRMRSSDFC